MQLTAKSDSPLKILLRHDLRMLQSEAPFLPLYRFFAYGRLEGIEHDMIGPVADGMDILNFVNLVDQNTKFLTIPPANPTQASAWSALLIL